MDTWEGLSGLPISQHSFVYAQSDPVNRTDRTGNFADIAEVEVVATVGVKVDLTPALGFLAIAGMVAADALDRQERKTDAEKYLYRFGNAGGPYPPRVPGDIEPDLAGMVGPKLPWPDGASVYSNWETAPLHGWFYRIQKQAVAVSLIQALGVVADGLDAAPPGPHSVGHHTIFPLVRMKAQEFVDAFMALPWQKVAKKP